MVQRISTKTYGICCSLTPRYHYQLFSYPYNQSIMSTQKAVLHESEGVSQLKTDVPLPKLPSGNWMLVETKAVALNPTDWKNIARATAPGAIAGCDYAGVVEEVGEGVTDVKVGDKVAGFVRGGELVFINSLIIANFDR
jgi:hypothetical protein